jgi:uncharacterized protein (UPF0332 family)
MTQQIEIELYLERARSALQQARDNLNLDYYSRLDSDYDMTFSAERTLAEDVLRDAQHFVDRTERYLRQAGVL